MANTAASSQCESARASTKSPHRDGERASARRTILRIVSVERPADTALSHPTEVATWLKMQYGIHVVGSLVASREVSKNESQSLPSHSFFTLVDNPMEVSQLAKLKLFRSKGIKVTHWAALGQNLMLRPDELHLVDALPALQEPGVETAAKKVTTDSLLTAALESRKHGSRELDKEWQRAA